MFLSLPWGHRQSEPKFPLIIPVTDICTHIRMQQYVLLAGGALAGQRKQECRLDFRPWRSEWIAKTGEGTGAGQLLWLCLPCRESSRGGWDSHSVPTERINERGEGLGRRKEVHHRLKKEVLVFMHLKSRNLYLVGSMLHFLFSPLIINYLQPCFITSKIVLKL